MNDSKGITYRSLTNPSPRVWHFCADCPDWPQGSLGYIERTVPEHQLFAGDSLDPKVTKPTDGAVCDQCLGRWNNGTCQLAQQ